MLGKCSAKIRVITVLKFCKSKKAGKIEPCTQLKKKLGVAGWLKCFDMNCYSSSRQTVNPKYNQNCMVGLLPSTKCSIVSCRSIVQLGGLVLGSL